MTRRRNRHIGSSLDDWLRDESAKDASFVAGLDEQFDRFRLAQQLKVMRLGAGLSQAELAERVRTKQPSIARIEKAQTLPKLDFLQRVAQGLGWKMEVRFKRIQAVRRIRSVKRRTRVRSTRR